jgi:hypothetical protein
MLVEMFFSYAITVLEISWQFVMADIAGRWQTVDDSYAVN